MSTDSIPPIQDLVAKERERCARCVSVHASLVEDDQATKALLLRIIDFIRLGEEDPKPYGDNMPD